MSKSTKQYLDIIADCLWNGHASLFVGDTLNVGLEFSLPFFQEKGRKITFSLSLPHKTMHDAPQTPIR